MGSEYTKRKTLGDSGETPEAVKSDSPEKKRGKKLSVLARLKSEGLFSADTKPKKEKKKRSRKNDKKADKTASG